MTDTVHIDDLATPRFSIEAQQMVDAMTSVAEFCPLDADALHQRASADTGLTDFGSQDYRERLDVLLDAFGELPGMTPAGRTYAFSLLTMFLKARLQIVDHLTHHPEILEMEVPAPLIIAGLPRRARPNTPCLIEPYDLAKQFDILRRLEPTDVLAPRALWIEPKGNVIGREFFVMNRLPGSVYEMGPPTGTSPELVNHMCHSMIEQLDALHNVDIQARGLHDIDGGGERAPEPRSRALAV